MYICKTKHRDMTLSDFTNYFSSIKTEMEIRDRQPYIYYSESWGEGFGFSLEDNKMQLWDAEGNEIQMQDSFRAIVTDFCSELEEEYHQEAERPYNPFTDHCDPYHTFGVQPSNFINL